MKILPNDPDAEKGILGSMFHSPDAIAEVYSEIRAECFYLPAHQVIYLKMVELWHAQIGLDLITLTSALRDSHSLEKVGGASTLTGIYIFVPSAANLEHYVNIVREKHALRQLITICSDCIDRAFEEQADAGEAVIRARKEICAIEQQPGQEKRRTNKELVAAVIHRLDNPEKALGISTGLLRLDNAIGGMVQGANIVLAGTTSCGKSALAQFIVDHVGVTKQIPIALFTFEMTDEQAIQRIIQIRSEVSAYKIAKGEAELFDVNRFVRASDEIAASPIHVISDRLDVAGIRARCMQLRPRVAIIDYLQIIPEKQQKGETRTERFDRMSSEVKQLALQFQMTTIILSQLNEKETTYGSSMMTNDADILLVIKSEEEPDESKSIQDKSIKVAKQRDGGRPTIHLSFVKNITKFKERKE